MKEAVHSTQYTVHSTQYTTVLSLSITNARSLGSWALHSPLDGIMSGGLSPSPRTWTHSASPWHGLFIEYYGGTSVTSNDKGYWTDP